MLITVHQTLRIAMRFAFSFFFAIMSFTSAFAAESISITATPRYPWNGKVDLKFTIDGTSGTKYDTSFTAKDVAGGTNLTMKTLYKSDGTAANVAKEQLLPGTYNWVWDATADLGDGTVLEKVVVEGKVVEAIPLYMVIDLSSGASSSKYPVSYLEDVPSGGWTDTYKTTKMVLRYIAPGTFTMGSPSSEGSRQSNETQHKVTLTKGYYLGVFEVTQKQYKLIMNSSPSRYSGDTRPVEQVPWMKVRESQSWPKSSSVGSNSFMGKLRSRTGLTTVDLPTEAQWEYACRAGTSTMFNNGTSNEAGLKKVGRYTGNKSDGKGGYSQHTKVGSYAPNAWGLYDMHGNVFEWCLDYWNASGYGSAAVTDPKGPTSYVNSGEGSMPRIRRGGYYGSPYGSCRSARRHYGSTDNYYLETVYLEGIRVCVPLK